MQHPWLLDNSQVNHANLFISYCKLHLLLSQGWYFDQANEDKNKTLLENMIHEEKKHFTTTATVTNLLPTVTPAVAVSKVSPMWTKDDVDSLRKGIVR